MELRAICHAFNFLPHSFGSNLFFFGATYLFAEGVLFVNVRKASELLGGAGNVRLRSLFCERAEEIRAPGGWVTSVCERAEGRPDVVVAQVHITKPALNMSTKAPTN
ncbi:uncharacterized protein N7529_004532 [Penicillium soppii]|uniref:uncharacterized protein n=1 Tax=Penicillium soppii TaxID=69789 RepID=UPI0025477AD1|nr:uncharacterized protein N7529_004532 [Penicillium soppii]KAJ5872179.1 hypothetical protein N7529_004532 [Penicillium soppii]